MMSISNNQIKGVEDFIKSLHQANAVISLEFGGCAITVKSNNDALITALADYFSPFIGKADADYDILITAFEMPAPELPLEYIEKPPDQGKRKIKEEFVELPPYRIVRKRLTGMVFIFGESTHLAAGPCLKNLNQVVNFINNRYIEWKLCRGCLLGHAAGVIIDGKGLALAGFSGAGKSTLALHLMSLGAVFVSNDRLMIEKDKANQTLYMHGVAKLPRINPGTALHNPDLSGILNEDEKQRFGSIPGDELWHLEHKYDVPIKDCFGSDRFVLSSRMHGLVILNWRNQGNRTSCRQVDPKVRSDLLPAFMKSSGLFITPSLTCRSPEPDINAYADFLSSCRVWEFTGAVDFHYATGEIRRCLSMLSND